MEKIIVDESNIRLEIYVKPNSKKNKFLVDKDDLIVQIRDSPVKGKANKSIIQFLSKMFNISKSQITIISGMKSRIKRINLLDLSLEQKNRIIQLLNKAR